MDEERQEPVREPEPGGRRKPPPSRGGRRGRATRALDPDRPCLNCGDPTTGAYCPTCGQRKVDVQVSVRAMALDLLEDQFILDQRLPRTMGALFFKPGFLTVEHVNGRIVRYIRPFKLYLASSVVFFLLLSFFSLQLLERASFNGGDRIPGAATDSVALATLDSLLADTTLPAGIRPALAVGRDTVLTRLGRADSLRLTRQQERRNWMSDVEVNTGFARADSIIAGRLARLGGMEPQQAVTTVVRDFLGYVPTVMFVLLPIFALALKVLYIRRRRYYAEHFVFLLHTHSFVFLVFTLLILLKELDWLNGWVIATLLGWILVYVYIAMTRVYGQGWLRTFIKYWILGWTYFWVLTLSVPVAVVIALLLG